MPSHKHKPRFLKGKTKKTFVVKGDKSEWVLSIDYTKKIPFKGKNKKIFRKDVKITTIKTSTLKETILEYTKIKNRFVYLQMGCSDFKICREKVNANWRFDYKYSPTKTREIKKVSSYINCGEYREKPPKNCFVIASLSPKQTVICYVVGGKSKNIVTLIN